MEYRLGELFSGAGAIGLGAWSASSGVDGSSIVHAWAVDTDSDACVTYRDNVPGADDQSVICIDVRTLDVAELPSANAISFPFSSSDFTLGGQRKSLKTGRAAPWRYGIKMLHEHQPDWFLAYDTYVPLDGKAVIKFDEMLSKMSEAGYQVHYRFYRWSDYGIPQERQQWVVVGIRQDLDVEYMSPIAHADVYNSVGKALIESPIPPHAANNELPRHGAKLVELLGYIPPGQNAFTASLPQELDPLKGSRSRRTYRRLHPEKLSYPVTSATGEATDLYHWSEHRALTNRERARLQTFPDQFVFRGSAKSVRRQIGLALPVQGARIVLQSVLQSLSFAGIGTGAAVPVQALPPDQPEVAKTDGLSEEETVSFRKPISATYDKKKLVHFYAVHTRRGHAHRRSINAVNWCQLMEERKNLGDEKNTVNGVVFDHMTEGDMALLIMHRPLSPAFMTRLAQGGNRDTSKEDQIALRRFAQATAVAFCVDGRIIAIGKGSQSSPGTKALTDYLDHVVPQSDGWRWTVSAFEVDGTPEELHRATGVRRFKMRYQTARDLFVPGAMDGDALAVGPESIARELGTDISVHVEFGLPMSSPASHRRALLRLVEEGLETIKSHSPKSPPQVIAEVDGEEQEYLLTKHKLTRQVEIPLFEAQQQSFSVLSAAVVRVAREAEKEINKDRREKGESA